MQRRTPLTVKSMEQSLGKWLKEHSSASIVEQADELPLRRDMVTLLSFVRDSKVVGTQGTGNMPLKAVREVTACFVHPPKLEATIGDHTYHLRSEADLWPLYFLHVLAEVGGLLKTGRARRWQLTAQGRRFLGIDPILQVLFLLSVWWYRVNWIVAFPVRGLGGQLPMFFQAITLARLRALPAGNFVSFDRFADQLVEATGLTWTAPDCSTTHLLLRSSISRMVVGILAEFGAVECKYQKEPLGKGFIPRLVAFKVTPWGQALIDGITVSR